jgi:DNA-binding CsgD family transcriptional regulator
MSLTTGYLTSKQKLIWDLKRKGLSEANIARKLKVTRQTIHKALDIANSKVYAALKEAATINKIGIKAMDPAQGVVVGYSPDFKTDAIILFSAKNGIQVWYKHEGDCRNCDQLQTCRKMLLVEAEDRNMQLPENANSMMPSKLAEILFSKIIGE